MSNTMDKGNQSEDWQTPRLKGVSIYFDKSAILSANKAEWIEFWGMAKQAGVRGYFTPIAFIEVVSGLFVKFKKNWSCLNKIALASLDVLPCSELVIVRHLLGTIEAPEGFWRDEENNYRVFRGVPDHIVTYCKSEDSLRKPVVVDVRNCPENVRKLIESQRSLQSSLLTVVQKKEGPRYCVTLDLNSIRELRARYEARWRRIMLAMRELVVTDLSERARRLGKPRMDKQMVVTVFSSPDFKAMFAEATLDRALGFLYGTEGPFTRAGGDNRVKSEIADKIDRLSAFYQFYKNMIIAEITGGSQKNDHNDLHQLVYLANGFYFITNDKRLRGMIASSPQCRFVMGFQEALRLLRENVHDRDSSDV